MSVYVREKKGRLYLDTIIGRQHHWESLGIQVSKDPIIKKEQYRIAEQARAKKEMQTVCGEWNLIDNVRGKQTLIAYMQQLAEAKSGSCKRSYNQTIAKIKTYKDGGNIKLVQITPEWVEGLQNWFSNDCNFKPSTASTYMGYVRGALVRAVRDKIIRSNPAEQVKSISCPEVILPTLTVDELAMLANTPMPINGEVAQQARIAFLFANYCGLRVSDVRGLKWADIEKRPINKYNTCPYWIKKIMQKTKAKIETPISLAAWALIKPTGALPFPDSYVFPKLTNSKHDNYYTELQKWAKAAGIEKHISFHTSRRSFATNELENGVDVFTVQRLMGHKNIKTTAKYAHSTDRMRAAAVEALPDVINDNSNDDAAAGGNA